MRDDLPYTSTGMSLKKGCAESSITRRLSPAEQHCSKTDAGAPAARACSRTPRAPELHLRCSFPTRRPSGKVGGKEGGVERVTLQVRSTVNDGRSTPSTSHSERWIPNSHGDHHPPSLARQTVIHSTPNTFCFTVS